jgi:AcrR family transcriptional regulator
MRPGRSRDRVLFALTASLEVLEPHRVPLRALITVLVGDPNEGIFAAATAFPRQRVQQVFEEAVSDASDAPKAPLAAALGRLFYLMHLAVLLWWLLDRRARQRTTRRLVSLIGQMLPSVSLALRLPGVRRFVVSLDELVRDGLVEPPVSG